MKNNIETKNKLFAGIFIFIISIYFATITHEIGHLIAYISFGCNFANVWVSPLIVGYMECYSPQGFELSGFLPNFIATMAGILFVFLIGLISFLFYRCSKYVRKHYILTLIFYFFAFNCLLNGFLQSISGNDINELKLNMFPFLAYVYAGVVGLILLFHIFKFKELILLVEPKTKQKTAKIISIGFLILFILISFVYFSLPYLL